MLGVLFFLTQVKKVVNSVTTLLFIFSFSMNEKVGLRDILLIGKAGILVNQDWKYGGAGSSLKT